MDSCKLKSDDDLQLLTKIYKQKNKNIKYSKDKYCFILNHFARDI